MAGLLDLISARNPGEARQTLADLVRGPQNRLRGLLDSPVGFLTDALNDVVPTGQQAAEQLQRYQLPMSQDYAMGPSGYDNKLKDMALAGLTVYHGSPHKFDKFDMNKIGTGEGAQAYGHGLYFAENPGVAKSYIPPNTQAQETIAGLLKKETARAQRYSNEGGMEVYEMFNKGYTPAGIRANIDNLIESGVAHPAYIKKMEQAYKKATEIYQANPAGSMYKVDLPDEAIAKMLDWDKPLSEQAPEVRAAIGGLGDIKTWNHGGITYPNPEILREGGLYGALERQLGDKGVSGYLKSKGIPGIRYLDGGSRGTGSGTSNYVVFDDSLLKILERNGMPVP